MMNIRNYAQIDVPKPPQPNDMQGQHQMQRPGNSFEIGEDQQMVYTQQSVNNTNPGGESMQVHGYTDDGHAQNYSGIQLYQGRDQ